MPRENLQLISCRLDSDALGVIENFCIHHPYWKRNAVINHILWCVTHDFDEKQIYDMVRRNMFRQQSIIAEYEITSDLARPPRG